MILVASQSFWPVRDLVSREVLDDQFELVRAMDLEIPEEARERVVAIVLADQSVGATEMDRFPKLQTLARTGTGYDNIDLMEAEKRGICVTRVSVLNAESVSEFAIGLIFALTRNIVQTHNRMMKSVWQRGNGLLFKEMTVGLIGLGAVGQSLAKKLYAFGVKRLIGWNRSTFRLEVNELADDCALELVSAEKVFLESDAVVVALALTPETKGFVGKERLSLMKPEAVLVNVGRGAVVDEESLADMVLGGQLGGAALDVYSVENPEPWFEQPYMKKLVAAAEAGRNVILTPHNAATTRNSSRNVALQVGRNVLKVLRGETEGLEIVKATKADQK